MLISGAGGSNFPDTTAELCTAYCLFYYWGLWCLCVNCASARYHLSPLPLKQNCGENRLKLCLPQKGNLTTGYAIWDERDREVGNVYSQLRTRPVCARS